MCVIDLDTVMPGFVLSDIGDFIRTAANTGAEDDENYEAKLKELCQNIENDIPTDLSEYSSIMFGFESAIHDLSNGGKRICFPSPFTEGKYNIPINGLVWMGNKDEISAYCYTEDFTGRKVPSLRVAFRLYYMLAGITDLQQRRMKNSMDTPTKKKHVRKEQKTTHSKSVPGMPLISERHKQDLEDRYQYPERIQRKH